VSSNLRYLENLGRAAVGAVLFALPLFMTMEMWALGFAMDRLRLAALLVVTFPLLVALSYLAGFERAFGLVEHVLDACAAIAVAAATATAALLLLGVFEPDQPFQEIVGKIAVLSFPGALGALLVDKQLGDSERVADAEGRSYQARLVLMAAGALFMALNVAPTEEVRIVAFRLRPDQSAMLASVSLFVLHALLFWVDLPGRSGRRCDRGFLSTLVRMSCPGYAISLLACLFLLWAFGGTDHLTASEALELSVVLAFPAAFGAGLAGLVVGEQRD
jgi:putative integral membrane protein (TIGR02587 family)